jgi:hypothetical protein
VQHQCVYVVGGLQPGAALVVVCLAIVTLPPSSTVPAVADCHLVGCSVVSGLPLCSHGSVEDTKLSTNKQHSLAVAGVCCRFCVRLGPVLASHAPSPSAGDAAVWQGRGRVPIAGWSYGRVGPERGLRGGGRRG